MSNRRRRKPQTKSIQKVVVDRKNAEFQRANEAMRSFYSNAVAWGTNLLTDARDEYSIDDATAARMYGINVTAWACAHFRAMTESGIECKLQDENEEDIEYDDNPIQWFFDNYFYLMFRVSISLQIWGKFYLRKVYNKRGIPTRLEYLSPLDVSPVVDYDKQEFRGFHVRGHNDMIAPRNMIYELTYDPLNDFDGVSPYEVAMRQIVAGRELIRFGQKYFEDGTMLGGMLSYEGEMSDEEYKEVKAQFQQFKGSQNAFKTFIAGGGLAKFSYTPMMPSIGDLAMPELKNLIDEDICSAFGVHPVLVGKGDPSDPMSAQNTYDQVHQKFTLEHAIPQVKWVAASLTRQWLTPDFSFWGPLYLVPDTDEIFAVIKGSQERSTIGNTATQRYWTIDEAREFTGKTPLPQPISIQINPDWATAVYNAGGITHAEFRQSIGLKPDKRIRGYIYEIDPRQAGQQSQLSFNFGHNGMPSGTDGSGVPANQNALPSSGPANPEENRGDTVPGNLLSARSLEAPLIANQIVENSVEQTLDDLRDEVLTKACLFELANWEKKIRKKGPLVNFVFNHIPPHIVEYVRSEVDGKWNVRSVFAEAKRAVTNNVVPAPMGATEEDAYEYWKHYDELKHDLSIDWLNYLKAISSQSADNVMHPDYDLGPIFDRNHGTLIDAWVGTKDAPGPMLSLVLAGMKAGDVALTKEIAANPHQVRSFDVGVSWDLLSDQALSFAKSYSYDLIRSIDTTTRDLIRSAIASSIEDAWSSDLLRDAIANVLVPATNVITTAIANRAKLIADSESARAFVNGSFRRWLDAGVTQATWLSVRDNTVCEVCRGLHGIVANIVTGWVSPATGKTYFDSAHPGCRCFRRPVVK